MPWEIFFAPVKIAIQTIVSQCRVDLVIRMVGVTMNAPCNCFRALLVSQRVHEGMLVMASRCASGIHSSMSPSVIVRLTADAARTSGRAKCYPFSCVFMHKCTWHCCSDLSSVASSGDHQPFRLSGISHNDLTGTWRIIRNVFLFFPDG
jgi:hypothetical protein